MTWRNILKHLFFGGVRFFDDKTRVTYCSHLVHSNDIQEINMSSNTCHFKFLCDTHAEKYKTALNNNNNNIYYL